MREIVFRAKTKNSGRWAYGDLVTQRYNSRQGIHIYEKNDKMQSGYQFVRIDKKTICQYIGLTDKNGKKIFEGDILKANNNQYLYKVYFDENRFFIEDKWGNAIKPIQRAIDHFECEIVGNVFDNPDLLGESNEN